VYYTMQGSALIILLVGGDKRSQSTDVRTALRLARDL
jgi:putative addiction module killer protein